MPVNQSNNGKNINSQFEINANSEAEKRSQVVLESDKKQSDLNNSDRQKELIIEESSDRDSISPRLKVKITTLIGSAVILPILAVGTACYYFAHQAIDKQIVWAKRSNLVVAQTELIRQKNLLTALLIGTGTTALVAGAIAVSRTKKLIDSESEISKSDPPQVDKPELDFSWEDVFQATVEEVRRDLHCDRVMVYSLEDPADGTIVAESAVAGYTQGIDRKIDNLDKYLEHYDNERVRVIDDIEGSNLNFEEREQLKQLEVKASMVTPIVFKGRLLGLLVAHQCSAPRKWQQSEINLLHRTAQKAGLTIENALVSDRFTHLETKTEKASKYADYFDDAVRHIRQAIEPDKILEIGVEFVHRVLKCDRVVVYSLGQDNYGMVIAESVSVGSSRAENKTIADLDMYRDGRVHAIDNIYQAQLSQGYIESLEALAVKAELVTPIVFQGKLSALLVAHQCDRQRNWLDYEIRWMSSIATQVGFALDNAWVLAESATIRGRVETERKWTYYFDDAVRHIRQAVEPDKILEIGVEFVHRVLKCDRVVVYSLGQDNYGMVIAESVSAGRSRAENKTIADPDVYRDGRVRAIDNIYQAQLSQGYIRQLEALEVKAELVTPIVFQGKSVLVAHQCDRQRNWLDYEIRWMSSIATQVGFALDNAILLKKLQHDERSTQLLNDFSFKISRTANKSELLNTAVEQVRKIIKLDRAVVYQFDPERATVVAESVGSGYPQASLNDYLTEEYQENSTRVEAIADIHKSNLSDRHLKQLESLGVKATITAPILRDKQLFGLLIGHQCQQPRSWSQSETNLFTQFAWQIGLVLDRVKLEELILIKNSQSDRGYTESNNLAQNSTTIVKTIDIEELDLLEPDLYKMLGTLHDLRNSDRQIKRVESTQLSIEEITIEAEEIVDLENNSELATITGEFVDKLSASSQVINLNQSEGDITELSDRISQQSLFVTESFQKLAILAKQLSEKDKK